MTQRSSPVTASDRGSSPTGICRVPRASPVDSETVSSLALTTHIAPPAGAKAIGLVLTGTDADDRPAVELADRVRGHGSGHDTAGWYGGPTEPLLGRRCRP